MNLYISGISGTGMGPLALMSRAAGMNVYGSDRAEGTITPELRSAGIEFSIGEQDGKYLASKHAEAGIDWFIYTSALPEGHPELVLAKKEGIRTSKRDELIAYLVDKLGFRMVAVAGTHGKTTTTAMLIWAVLNLTDSEGAPVLPSSYLVGTTLNFAKSGSYRKGDRFLLYEADEYDRNFLHFSPWLSVITYVSYDHPDIYPTVKDYEAAFTAFESQSENIIYGSANAVHDGCILSRNADEHPPAPDDPRFTLAGAARREDAVMAFRAIRCMLALRDEETGSPSGITDERIIDILNAFPGTGRRFERLADGLYSDYAHHPEEIKATVAIALEEAERTGRKGVVAIYQPHQNTRQHEVRHLYPDSFDGVERLYWLPTYLTRENEALAVITPQEFIHDLNVRDRAFAAELSDSLAEDIRTFLDEGYLVILMTAGPAHQWLVDNFACK